MDKPPCQCGHSYSLHSFGTTDCTYQFTSKAQNGVHYQRCDCLAYRESLCPCGHAWEIHGLRNTSNKLVCPVCGKECEHWELMSTKTVKVGGKGDEFNPSEVCVCGHSRAWHDGYESECEAGIGCTCDVFSGTGIAVTDECACKHTRLAHTKDGICTREDCKCQKFEEKTVFDTRQNWQKELEAEERDKPDCVCGHKYDSHFDEGDKLPCAECYEPIEINETQSWETTCKDYTPQQGNLFSDDPVKANQEALKQIGNTGKMTTEEINAKIDEWKAKQGYTDTSGAIPKGQPFGGVYDKQNPYNAGGFFAKCSHAPIHVIDGKTWEVWAGTKSCCLPTALDYDIILNVSNGYKVVPQHDIPFKWAEKYQLKTKEIFLDWPDGSIPLIPSVFWVDLVKQLRKSKAKMIVFCIGGHGRTGTAIACILLALGWTPDQAKDWIWKNYCKEAIETQEQEKYIDIVYRQLNPPRKGNPENRQEKK